MGCGTSRRVGEIQPSNTARDPDHPIRPPKKKKSDVVSPPEAFARIDEEQRCETYTTIRKYRCHLIQPADDSLDGLMGYGTSRRVGVVETSNIAKDPNPPIRPPQKKKRDLVPPPEAFAHIDEHALKAPSSVRSSVATLAQYLVAPARNDMEKLRAIYRWIAENISYDTDALFSGNYGSQNADSVLQRGAGVCGGYATVFNALCNEVRIPCKKVIGFAKAFGYDTKEHFTLNTKTYHAWNIVFVNGEWRPIEATWGAGYLNSENKFEKCFEEIYFLTDPEDFVTKHFPFIDMNLDASLPLQLLKQPWSLKMFSKALCPPTNGIEWGFESLSHNTQIITVDKECEIKFKTSNVALQDVLCHLLERNTKRDYKQCVLLRKKGDMFTAKVTPPAEGTYDLELYGKPVESTETTYTMLNKYVVRCQAVMEDVQPYPEKSGIWGAKCDGNRYGFTNDIFGYDVITTKNGEVEMRIKTDRYVPVSVKLVHAENTASDLNRFVFESFEGNTLVMKVRCPYAGFYKLTLFAKDPDKEADTHDQVAQFLIESKKPLDKAQPFPKTYTIVQKFGCLLIQPLTGDLPAHQDVHLKLRSDKLVRVMINKKVNKTCENGEYDITFQTPGTGETVKVYGSQDTDGSLDALYEFQII